MFKKLGEDRTQSLSDTAVYAPDAVSFRQRLYIAWAGTDARHRLNVMASSDAKVWVDKVTLEDTSELGISLTAFSDRLYIAWTDRDKRLNVMSSANGTEWTQKVTLDEKSNSRPIIHAHSYPMSQIPHDDQLVLGWTGTDSRLNLLFSNDGIRWTDKRTLNERSIDTPALVSFLNYEDWKNAVKAQKEPKIRLYVAWTGTNPSHNLNVMYTSDNGASWHNKRVLSDTSCAGPSLLRANNYLYLAWAGTDAQHRINTMMSSYGDNWFNKHTFNDSTDYSPELFEHYDTRGLIWTNPHRPYLGLMMIQD